MGYLLNNNSFFYKKLVIVSLYVTENGIISIIATIKYLLYLLINIKLEFQFLNLLYLCQLIHFLKFYIQINK